MIRTGRTAILLAESWPISRWKLLIWHVLQLFINLISWLVWLVSLMSFMAGEVCSACLWKSYSCASHSRALSSRFSWRSPSESKAGAILALADKLDTLLIFFSVGQVKRPICFSTQQHKELFDLEDFGWRFQRIDREPLCLIIWKFNLW